jgi:hypothetical protein
MNRISDILGPVKPAQSLGGRVAISYRNGAEILVEWRQWRDEVWTHCPYASQDKTKCSVQLCPCDLAYVGLWMNTISGYLGTVKLVKYLGRDNGNGRGNGQAKDHAPADGEYAEPQDGTDRQVG